MQARLDDILARCRTPAGGGRVRLDEEERRRLRALGYVN